MFTVFIYTTLVYSGVLAGTPTEKDKSSLKFSLEATEEDKRNRSVLVAQNVPKKPWNTAFATDHDLYIQIGNWHIAWTNILLRSSKIWWMHVSLVWFQMITHGDICLSHAERYHTILPKALNHHPLFCFHCGGISGASLANDSDIVELQKLHGGQAYLHFL